MMYEGSMRFRARRVAMRRVSWADQRISCRFCALRSALFLGCRFWGCRGIGVVADRRHHCEGETILRGLKGVGHVIADAAYDADPLCAFIADNLGATAQIKANPSRATVPPIDWRLYKQRHQVECFFNKLNAFAGSHCAVRKHSQPSWASSISHLP